MKKVIFIFAVLLPNFLSSQETSFGDVIKGSVDEYTETFYKANKNKNGKYEKGHYLYDITYQKNQYGEFVEYRLFPDTKTNQNKYNEKKQKIETTNYYDDGSVINRTKFIYNKERLIEKLFYYQSDTIINKTLFEYNKDNLLSKAIRLSYDYDYGKITIDTTTTLYKYDEKGNKIEELFESSRQRITEKFVYNPKNYLIEYYFCDQFPQKIELHLLLTKRVTYLKYDENNWLECIFEDGLNSKSPDKPDVFFVERKIKYSK